MPSRPRLTPSIIKTISHRNFSTTPRRLEALRIGYVPEHFSTPLYFARRHHSLDAILRPFPSGTGAMITSLRAKEIDIGIGLTEGWVAGLGKTQSFNKGGYKIVGTYVESPLCWALSTGAKRNDVKSVGDVKGGRIGVSRIGSGSYVMGFVLADQRGWLRTGEKPFEVAVLNDFKGLRDGVNGGMVDFFMWEHFTSKRYYDSGEIKRIGEIYTPWSSWKIVAREPEDGRIDEVMEKINGGVKHFKENPDEAVRYISTELDYSEEDAREWMKTVRFSEDVRGVDTVIIDKTIEILGKAGVLEAGCVSSEDMVAIKRQSKSPSP